MSKVIRLTEADLTRLVRRVIQESSLNMSDMKTFQSITVADVMDCAKSNNFDLTIPIQFPDDRLGLGQSCIKMMKTKSDKTALECAFAISQSAFFTANKPQKGLDKMLQCLKNKIMMKMAGR